MRPGAWRRTIDRPSPSSGVRHSPTARIEVTEHQVSDWVYSGCQTLNQGQFPQDVRSNTQYDFRLVAMSALFNNAYNIPLNKVQSIFSDLYGVTLNEKILQAQDEFTYACLAEDEAHIKTKLLKSKAVNFDETGFYVAKDRFWEHVASNEFYTALFVDPQRGVAADQTDISILSSFQNWAVHDCWSTYLNFTECQHAICGAHLLRVFTALIESGSKWAQISTPFYLTCTNTLTKARLRSRQKNESKSFENSKICSNKQIKKSRRR